MIIKGIVATATTGSAFTVTGFAALSIAFATAVFIFGRLPVLFVPLVRLEGRSPLKRSNTRHATHVGQLTLEVRVDCEVHANVVNLGQSALWLTTGDMFKNQMVELMLKNTKLLHVGQTLEELSVIHENELRRLLIHHHARSRNRSR